MAIDFVDILERDARYLIMLADGQARSRDILPQLCIKDEVDIHIGIAVGDMLEHVGHSRSESIEISLGPVRVFILP